MRVTIGTLCDLIREVMIGSNTYKVTLADFYAVARQQSQGKTYLKKASGGVYAPYYIADSFDPKRSSSLLSVMKRHGARPFDIMSAIKKGSVTLDSGLKIVADGVIQQQVMGIIARGIAENAKMNKVDAVVCADSRSPMAQELALRVSSMLNVPFIKGAFRKSNDPTSLKIHDEVFDEYAKKHKHEPEKVARFRDHLEKELRTLRNKARNSKYFSIADNVDIKHRKYFKGYHKAQAEEILDTKRLLIIDDNLDTGTTMRDLADIAKSFGIQPFMAAGFKINR